MAAQPQVEFRICVHTAGHHRRIYVKNHPVGQRNPMQRAIIVDVQCLDRRIDDLNAQGFQRVR